MQPSYTYRANVIRWVDGDTVDLRVDCGFYLWWEGRFRLYGINTPERGHPNYTEATAYAAGMAPIGSPLVVRTYHADKYGRFLADLYVGETNVNAALINVGLAVPYYP